MNVPMAAFLVVVSMVIGYMSGAADQRKSAIETKRICFDETFMNHKKGCYQVYEPEAVVVGSN